MTDDALLAVRDLQKHYPVRSGLLRRVTDHVQAVDGVSFDVREGETFGLVGESGCGKSTTATTLLGLEEPTGGDVYFDGEPLAAYEDKQFRRRAQMVFQDPNAAFDPQLTVGESVAEPLAIHGLRDGDRQREVVADALERVGLSADDADRYPADLSGGQKQRVALARALVLNPDLLVADEPVSALDVSVQAEILSLLDDLQADLGLSVLLISHDLDVVRQVCDRVGVMYLGELVEVAPAGALFADPRHPYTEALLASIPDPDPRSRGDGVELAGDVPDPQHPPGGCSFHPRCPRVVPPEEYDVGESFREVLDFRLAVEDGDVDTATLEDPSAVRERYDLPATLADPDADAALSAAIDDVVRGDVDAAADRLASAFPTVCERENPELVAIGGGRAAACHRHDVDAGDRPLSEPEG